MSNQCSNCKVGTMRPGIVTVTKTTDRGTYTIQVPGRVCDNCGESAVNQLVQREILDAWSERIDAEERRQSA